MGAADDANEASCQEDSSPKRINGQRDQCCFFETLVNAKIAERACGCSPDAEAASTGSLFCGVEMPRGTYCICGIDNMTTTSGKDVRPKANYMYMDYKPVAKRKRRKGNKAAGAGQKIGKWRHVPLDEFGFIMSMFPRERQQSVADEISEDLEEFIVSAEHFVALEEKVLQWERSNIHAKSVRADGHIRYKKKHKKLKAYTEVKTKHCKNVTNNNGEKLYIEHFIHKKIKMDENRRHKMPSPPPRDIQSQTLNNSTASSPVSSKPPQPQRHALNENNVPLSLRSAVADARLIQLLIQLQHRDVTPQDYELLLTLDNGVKPKTLDGKVLNTFKIETVSVATDERCAICMDNFIPGQIKKFLPCNHGYHEICIDTWLSNSSTNCPVDGLPVNR